MDDKILQEVIEEFSHIKEVKAIALGGSTGAKTSDPLSDYDIYIFSDTEVSPEQREEIAKKYSDRYEIHNTYFGDGDEWYRRGDEKVFDLMFWNRKWLEDIIESIWHRHDAWGGYTTCFLYTVKNARILYDPDGWFGALQTKLQTPYPQELADNIILKNRMMIKDKISASFKEQIEKAVKRNDFVSVNHRISAFLAGYFDIIFAANKLLHPGEKRLVQYAIKNCKRLPADFAENIENLCCNTDKITTLNNICNELDKFLNTKAY